MNRMVQDFLSNRWNLYVLQVLCVTYIYLLIYSHIGWVQLSAIGMCIYLVGICQRILGVRFGMLFYDVNRKKFDRIIKEIEKNKED